MTAIQTWVRLLEAPIAAGIASSTDDAGLIAARLAGRGTPAGAFPPVRSPRADQAAFLNYARVLVGGGSNEFKPVDLTTRSDGARFLARDGRSVVVAAWTDLARAAGNSSRNAESIARLISSQQEGPFLQFGPDDQPEAWWYDELVLLHAVTSFSVLKADGNALAAARKAARFHQREIQSDHATADPWALHTFVLAGPETVSAADSLLNACLVQYGGEPRGVALVLLAEALYCLRRVATHAEPNPG